MISKIVKIQNPDGMHIKPANEFVKLAQKFKSKIYLSKDGNKVEGKSLLSVLALAAGEGNELEIIAEGIDEKKAVETLANLIINHFTNKEKKNETNKLKPND